MVTETLNKPAAPEHFYKFKEKTTVPVKARFSVMSEIMRQLSDALPNWFDTDFIPKGYSPESVVVRYGSAGHQAIEKVQQDPSIQFLTQESETPLIPPPDNERNYTIQGDCILFNNVHAEIYAYRQIDARKAGNVAELARYRELARGFHEAAEAQTALMGERFNPHLEFKRRIERSVKKVLNPRRAGSPILR